ncbi:hypothetical protein GW17_00055508 [Ensete ventricosum]|nr:hypothetical protein GW17_00055508 [Ensete ventricosum]RZR91172.1 hypothetical protein BHM03_00019236 [Ensete ventricosum]
MTGRPTICQVGCHCGNSVDTELGRPSCVICPGLPGDVVWRAASRVGVAYGDQTDSFPAISFFPLGIMKSCHDFDSTVAEESLVTIRECHGISDEYVLHALLPE